MIHGKSIKAISYQEKQAFLPIVGQFLLQKLGQASPEFTVAKQHSEGTHIQ